MMPAGHQRDRAMGQAWGDVGEYGLEEEGQGSNQVKHETEYDPVGLLGMETFLSPISCL